MPEIESFVHELAHDSHIFTYSTIRLVNPNVKIEGMVKTCHTNPLEVKYYSYTVNLIECQLLSSMQLEIKPRYNPQFLYNLFAIYFS